MHESDRPLVITDQAYQRGRLFVLGLGGIAIVACIAGYFGQPRRVLFSYLTALTFFVTIGWGAVFFVCMHHLTGALWSVSVRRLMEGVMMTLPAAALAFIPLAFGLSELYEWTHGEVVDADPLLAWKSAYLNTPFFLLRTVAYFAVWTIGSLLFYRWSVDQDRAPKGRSVTDAVRWSGPFLIATFITVTFASFDWLMSLEAHWYSTVFGVYIYSGSAAGFVAALILIVEAFHRSGKLRDVISVEHQHDLARWLFTLTAFWAYIAFSQYMLIWYANIPEETVWFESRLAGGWRNVALALVVGHFITPFLVLMSRSAKRNRTVLTATAALVIVMHYLDLYWIVMPVLTPVATPHWTDAAVLVAVGSVVTAAFWWVLRECPLAPIGDPRLAESAALRRA